MNYFFSIKKGKVDKSVKNITFFSLKCFFNELLNSEYYVFSHFCIINSGWDINKNKDNNAFNQTKYISFLNYKMQCNTLLFNILKETPDAPRMVNIFCEETSASVQWISSFNGGDTQKFAVVVSNSHFETSYSDFIPDTGENEIHSKIIQNLQPSSEYLFSVSARNRLGESTSEKFKCTTKQKGFTFF